MRNLTLDAVYDMVDSLSERKRPCDINDVLNYKVWSKGRQDYIRLGDHYIEHLLRKIVKQTEEHHDKVARLEGLIEEKDKFIHKLIQEQEPKGWRYMFCDIPNKQIGKIFVRMLKKRVTRYVSKVSILMTRLRRQKVGRSMSSVNLSASLSVYVYMWIRYEYYLRQHSKC